MRYLGSYHCFHLKFFRKGSLCLLHGLFPSCLGSTSSSFPSTFFWVKTTSVMVCPTEHPPNPVQAQLVLRVYLPRHADTQIEMGLLVTHHAENICPLPLRASHGLIP